MATFVPCGGNCEDGQVCNRPLGVHVTVIAKGIDGIYRPMCKMQVPENILRSFKYPLDCIVETETAK